MNCIKCNNQINDGAKFCGECGAGVIPSTPSSVKYFAISLKRLAILSVITVGIYELYWFYKNWKAVKKSEGLDIYPFWRAFFSVFFCYSLFKKILESAKIRHFYGSYSAGLLASIYIILFVLGNALGKIETSDILFNLIWFIVAFSTFIPLLFIQKAINFNNKNLDENSEIKNEFSVGEIIIIIVVGVILFI